MSLLTLPTVLAWRVALMAALVALVALLPLLWLFWELLVLLLLALLALLPRLLLAVPLLVAVREDPTLPLRLLDLCVCTGTAASAWLVLVLNIALLYALLPVLAPLVSILVLLLLLAPLLTTVALVALSLAWFFCTWCAWLLACWLVLFVLLALWCVLFAWWRRFW